MAKKKKKNEVGERRVIWHIQDDGSVTPLIQKDLENDIAPVEKKQTGFFKKSDAVDNWSMSTGNDLLDFIQRTNAGVWGSIAEAGTNVTLGATKSIEGVGDFVQNRFADVQDFVGNKKGAEATRRKSEEEWGMNKAIRNFGDTMNTTSIFGDKSDAVWNGVGSSLLAMGTGALGGTIGGTALASVASLGTLGVGASGNSENEARLQMMADMKNKGYTTKQINDASRMYGLLAGTAETLSEMMFGGISRTSKVLGIGSGVFDSADDAIISSLTRNIQSKLVKNFVQAGLKATGEGFEEVASGFMDAVAKKMTYMKDEDLSKLLEDENLLDSFISGTLSATITQIPSYARSVTTRDVTVDKNGNVQKGKLRLQTNQEIRDFITNLNAQEQRVVEQEIENRLAQEDKITPKRRMQIEKQVVQDLDRGYITANTIRKTLGNDYVADRDVRLNESFREEIRRTQAYENKDLSNYTKGEQKIIKKAIKSGILNNSNRTHDFVDMVAKLCSQKGVDFDFTNNKNLAKSNFSVKGKTIDGFVDGKTVTVNIDSHKALNKVVGHEITHILEGTDLYTELQNTLKSFVGEREWDSRIKQLKEMYKTVKSAKVENELTSDLVGEYIFNDESFIRSLSTKNPNAFQKIYNEIKYMLNLATAGSKEARELEKAKHTFEKLYRENKTIENKQKLAISEENEIEMAKRLNKELTQAKSNLTKKENAFKMANSEEYTYQDENFAPEVAKARRAELREKTTKAHEEYVEAQERLEKAQKALDDFKNEKEAQFKQEFGEDLAFSLSENARNEVEEVLKLTQKEAEKSNIQFVKLKDNTIKSLVELGAEDLPMMQRVGHLRENILSEEEAQKLGFSIKDKDFHALGIDKYLEIIDSMDDATNIYQYTNNDKQFIVETPIKINGENSIVPVILKRNGRYNNVDILLNRIKTVFSPDTGYIDGLLDKGIIKKAVIGVKNQQVPLSDSNISQKANNVKFSLSVEEANTGVDNHGEELAIGMQDFMAKSKATDADGNLIRVFHTGGGVNLPMNMAQFNEFNPVGSPNYRYGDQVVNFFTDSKDMSGSYVDQNYAMANTSRYYNVADVEDMISYYNSSDLIEFSLRENNGKYELIDERDNGNVIHTFESEDDLFRNADRVVIEESGLNPYEEADGIQYEGYLNITNPYVVDAKGEQWNRIVNEKLQEYKKQIKEKWDIPERQLDRLEGQTLKELNRDLTKIGYHISRDEYGDLVLWSSDSKMAIDVINVNDIMQEVRSTIDSDSTYPLSTNDIVFQVLADNEMGANYDGVIIENVVDYGGAKLEEENPNSVYVTFNSNQFKAMDNIEPTSDSDIRYSLSSDALKDLSDELGDQYGYSYLEANLYNLDRDGVGRFLENHTNIVDKFLEEKKIKVDDVYQESKVKREFNGTKEMKKWIKDNDITLDKLADDKVLRQKYLDLTKMDSDSELYKTIDNSLDWYKTDKSKNPWLKTLEHDIDVVKGVYDQNPEIDYYATKDKKMEVAKKNGFDKWLKKKVEPLFHKEQHSVEEIMDEAEYQHGTTDDYAVGAYMTTNGNLLDFNDSGSGYRDDHRTISVFDLDMNEFMEAGAIRMKPETNGFEIAVEPTSEQYDRLYDYIDDYVKNHPENGDVYVDIDIPNTMNYDSHSYSIDTPASKIINDIKSYYETGTYPEQSQFADFYKYSLSDNGEMVDQDGNKVTLEASDTGTTNSLMAIHNLNKNKLKGILELGGFPVPSIAILDTNKMAHNEFGDISILFDKETINPKLRKNEVYDRDVWSPTFPRIEYEADEAVLKDIRKSLGLDNYGNMDSIQQKASLDLYQENIENQLDSWDLDGLKETLSKSRDLQYAYLKSKGLIEPVTKTNQFNSDVSNEVLQQFVEQYQGMTPWSWDTPLNELSYEQTMELKDNIKRLVKPYLEEQFAQYGKDGREVIKKELAKYDNFNKLSSFIYSANSLSRNGADYQIVDEFETLKKASELINKEEYEKWIDEKFDNIVKEKGIYNGKEIFTPMGNRRSFKALHNPVNLENLVKALSRGNTKGGQEKSIFGTGFGRISAQQAHRFNSIEDIKANQNRLMTREEATQIIEPLSIKLQNDTEALAGYYNIDTYGSDFVNGMQAMDNASEMVEDFASGALTLERFKRLLGEDYRISKDLPDSVLNNIIDDLNQAKNLPTDYFEAKPQRAVGLDEVQQVIIPNTLDAEFKKQLQDAGLKYTEYNPEIEGDRQRVINQFDDLKFSLSEQNEIAPTRDWNVRGQDIALQDAIAPLKEQIDRLTKAIDDVRLGVSNNLSDEDLAELENLEINAEPFLQYIDDSSELAKERKEYKDRANKQKEVYIPKNNNPFKTLLDTLSEMFVNKNVVIDNLSKDYRNPAIKHAGDMLNNATAEASGDINYFQTNNNGEKIGRGLRTMWDGARNKGLDKILNDYLLHWSNIDRHKQGKGSKVSSKDSYKIIKEYDAKYPQLKAMAKEVWDYSRNLRHNLRDAGIISQNVSDMLGRMYPHYVPYVSDSVDDHYFVDIGEIKPRSVIKRAKGGVNQSELLAVEEALTRYTYAQKKAVRQNKLYREIVKTIGDNVYIGGDSRTDYTNFVDSIYRDNTGNYLTAYENGEPISTRISDELYNSLSNQMENNIKDLEKRLSPILKPLQAFSKFKRDIVTKWSLTFPATNAIKDAQDAVFNSKYTTDMMRYYLNPSNLYELATNKGKAQQFKSLYGSGTDMGQSNVDSGLYDIKKLGKNLNFLKGVENVNELIELAPRYAEFKASLDNGCSLEEAMYNAREVTTNFSRGGVITKALNRNGFTFLNASVQGFDKFLRNFSGENGAKGVINSLIKATVLGIAPAIFNDLAFGSGDDKDEDYEALPDYIKDNYYIIKLGKNQGEYDDNGNVIKIGESTFLRIPKGRMLSVFGSLARRTLEYSNGEEDAYEGFLKNVDSQIGVNNPEENNVFAPLIQAYGSKNGTAWYGGDIVPTRLQNKPAPEQYDSSIDNLSIWLGEKTGLSPYKLNYVIDQYSGGIGDIALPLMTEEAKSDGGILAPVKDKFIINSTTDNKYVSDFYSANEELTIKANSEYATDEDILKSKYMSHISSEMSKLYKERREIQSDSTLSKKEKYARAQEIKKEINRLAKIGVKGYENMEITGNYAVINDDMGYYKNAKGNWTPIDQEDIQVTEGLGLTDLEKSSYYATKNDLYNLNQEYTNRSEGASEAEKKELSAQKKQDTIKTIKESGLPDDAKAYLYQKKYNDKLAEPIINIGMDADKYLDFKAQTFTADKDKNGKSISGSKKRKVFDYVNQMNVPLEQKAILIKSEYNTYDNYNFEILEYINSSNLSYEEKMELMKKLGFKIDGNKVSW